MRSCGEDVCFILVGPEVSNKKLYHLIPKKIRSFFYLLEERFDIAAINTGGYIWVYNGTTLLEKLTILATPVDQVAKDYINNSYSKN